MFKSTLLIVFSALLLALFFSSLNNDESSLVDSLFTKKNNEGRVGVVKPAVCDFYKDFVSDISVEVDESQKTYNVIFKDLGKVEVLKEGKKIIKGQYFLIAQNCKKMESTETIPEQERSEDVKDLYLGNTPSFSVVQRTQEEMKKRECHSMFVVDNKKQMKMECVLIVNEKAYILN